MKGLILSGGTGSRLRPLTYSNAKQLIPVANKPILVRVIETIRDAGITDIGIVVGSTAKQIKDVVGTGSRWGVKVTYIEQDAPLGLAHAVKISQDFLGDDRFVMFLGDNVIEGGISPLIAQFANSKWNSQIVLTRIPDPRQYGVAELGDNGRIINLVEKPQNPPSDLALVGIYMFDANVFKAVNAIKPSWRGELEITDALKWLVQNNYDVHPYIHEGWWIDTGKREDMLEANDLVLEEIDYEIAGYIDRESQVGRRVTIERGAEIINSVVRGPSIIGENARIVNSYIGPYTSIAKDVIVENSEIEHSMVLENSKIIDIGTRIQDSLIGSHVEISRSPIKPKALKLSLADYSQVGIL
ncbi:MAG: glucose-1-phosphate thymidylyltransferase [Ardenticatenaceae bacterium]|nr:glucose-1-phosphate thymidylyltransferase [Ardenticatenaceae bacterium]MCB9443060.1 glucose-1-phosphate thymidylyltransferase [Ardenticatenaceae bacterium]